MSENVIDIEKEITTENEALNLMVTFINIAQSRGAFTIQESAKIWECIKKFKNNTKME
jgi:hypothetical protein